MRPIKHIKKNTFKHEDAKNMKITKIFYYTILCSSRYHRIFRSSRLTFFTQPPKKLILSSVKKDLASAKSPHYLFYKLQIIRCIFTNSLIRRGTFQWNFLVVVPLHLFAPHWQPLFASQMIVLPWKPTPLHHVLPQFRSPSQDGQLI